MSAALSTSGGDTMLPSLAWSQQHAITFIPSLLPRMPEAAPSGRGGGDAGGLRDETAESYQRAAIWSHQTKDLALLLRLPTVEFVAHALYNKSLQRFVTTFLQQIPTVWQEVEGKGTHHWTATPDGEDGEEEKKSDAGSSFSSAASAESLESLRGIAKRVLLVYVRLCTPDESATWLTPTFFTTSFSASPLFASATLLDLVSFYMAVSPRAHRPLLAFVLEQVNTRVPYAFTSGMTHALNTLVQTLLTQVRAIHAPYIANSSAVKKARFMRGELTQLVRNLTAVMWSMYNICKLRPELLRLFVNDLVPKATSASATAPAPSQPPFLALLATLYTLTPLLLLQELGVKYAQLSAQPELMQLRRGCMHFFKLIQQKLILPSMGVKMPSTSKKSDGKQSNAITWSAPKQAEKSNSQTAGMSSTLPPPLSLSAACEVFFHSILLVHETVNGEKKDSLCTLPVSMKNLVSFNTGSTQNALLKRYNEYVFLDELCFFLYKQSESSGAETPGAILTKARCERLLNILHTIDAPLVKERIGWPLPKSASASASSSSSAAFGNFDERKGPSSMPLTRSNSSKGAVDLSLQISELADLFTHLSTDYIAACLSEYNGNVEQTTQAIVEDKLPGYLLAVKDKKRYKAGDVMKPGMMSRQSSTGSGMLDTPVDDDDELVARIGSGASPDDDADGFEAFLKRTGRISKETLASKSKKAGASTGAAAMLNSFDKSEAMLIANKIQASIAAQYNDERDDAYDDFEAFTVDAGAAEDDERTASLYDNRGGGDADEPDGSSYVSSGKYHANAQRGMRGGARGGSASTRGGRGGSAVGGATGGEDRGCRPINYENVHVPATFMAAPSGAPKLSVQDQWRRDEERKEIYVAMLKAQRAQKLPASRRTPEEQRDFEYGLKHGLIRSDEKPSAGGDGQASARGGASSQPASADAPSSQPAQRGGFSARGRSAYHHNPSTASGSHADDQRSASAQQQQPQQPNRQQSHSQQQPNQRQPYRHQPQQQGQQQHQQQRPQSQAQGSQAQAPSQPQAQAPSEPPARWDDDSGDDDGAPRSSTTGQQQQSSGPMDARARRQKERRGGGHNRSNHAKNKIQM